MRIDNHEQIARHLKRKEPQSPPSGLLPISYVKKLIFLPANLRSSCFVRRLSILSWSRRSLRNRFVSVNDSLFALKNRFVSVDPNASMSGTDLFLHG